MDAVSSLSTAPVGRRVFRVREAAEYLGMSESTVRREINAGRLPSGRIRSMTVVFEHELIEWLGNAR